MSAPAPILPAALQAQADQAERLAAQGQVESAARLYQQVLAQAPDYSRGLNFLAMRALGAGDLATARRWIDQAVAGQPRLAAIEANRALVLQAQGDDAGALAALEAALALDPAFLPARLDAGRLHEAAGRLRQATAHYAIAMEQIPAGAQLPPVLAGRVEQARAALAREQAELEAFVAGRLAPLRAGLGQGDGARFDECLDILTGRRKPQLPKPGFMYFPKLPPLSFYPRTLFPWAAEAEAATEAIRAEIEAVMAAQDGRFIPYVQKDGVGEGSAWRTLNHNRDWGVYFLHNQGERIEAHLAACPATAALLERLPLVRIPGRGPTAFFSRLKPGTHIPAHHGATNTRLICHLPLVIPEDCAIRVGNDVRAWTPGELLVFDDTMEHEAWNRSGRDRVVLIFDVWNPFLEPHERALVAEATAAYAEFFPGKLHSVD